MESKTRLWRRKHSDKAITKERVSDLQRSLKNLNEQLLSVRNESDTKDDLIGKQAKLVEEAIAGREKAEAEAVYFKLELDDALYQKAIAEEKVTSIDAALKECVQQLHALKDEQHRIVNDASVNILQGREKARVLEERLADANQKLQQLSVEKNDLCGILDMKEKLIKGLNVSKSQSEADFAAVVERLDFSEKCNESLKYEVLMLQKELGIRNQEREFNLRSAESAQKLHQENVKKINKLESECHRLRAMIRKRLPGPAAIAKMKSGVEMLGNSATEPGRNCTCHFAQEIRHDAPSKQVARLHGIEDENKILKETLKKKNSELQLSRIMFARTASKLSQAEKQLKELLKGPTCLELRRWSSVTNELPLASVSEHGGNKDAASCSESWTSSLMSQLEHFRISKSAIGSSQSSLMDDFEEMEKLAIVCADKPEEGSSMEESTFLTPKSLDLKPEFPEFMSKELVPFERSSHSGEFNHGGLSCFIQYEKYPIWLQDILKVVMQKHYTTQLNLDVILHEVKVALNNSKTIVKGKSLDPLFVGHNACQRPHHSSFTSADGLLGMKSFLPTETGDQLLQSRLESALHRIIELIKGFMQREMLNNDRQKPVSLKDPQHKPASSTTRQKKFIFLWESSELNMVLQRFIDECNNMLCGQAAEVERFVFELASTLGWIIDHCFSLRDVSAMEETIKKEFGGDFLFCDEDDAAVEVNSPKGANYKNGAHDKFKTIPDALFILSKMDIIGSKLSDENRKLKDKISNVEFGKKNLEEILKSSGAKNHSITTRFHESEKCISNSKAEMKVLKDARGVVEDQMLISKDPGTQLTAGKVELNETPQRSSSLGVELEEKSSCCEELKAKCPELQLHIESATDKDLPKLDIVPEEKELRTDWEISAASEKLAECQETILQLGRQLRALASPENAALFDHMISSPDISGNSSNPQLLEQLLAIDSVKSEDLKSPQTKEIICSEPPKTDAGFLNGQKSSVEFVSEDQESNFSCALRAKTPHRSHGELGGPQTQKCGTEVGALVSIPKKQIGGISLLKKLLPRKKKTAIRSWS